MQSRGNKVPPETKISGERVYRGRVLNLDVDRVELACGGEAVREVVRHPGAAVVVPVLDDGRLVLVRQFRYAAGETLLELPAGKRDDGEEPAACAARELAEEIGLAATHLEYLTSFFTAPGFTDEFIHCFVASGLYPAAGAVKDADEELDVVPVTLDEAHHLIASGEICDAKTIVGLLLYAARSSKKTTESRGGLGSGREDDRGSDLSADREKGTTLPLLDRQLTLTG